MVCPRSREAYSRWCWEQTLDRLGSFNTRRTNVPSIVQRSIMLIIFEEHVLGVKVMNSICRYTKWHWGYRVPLLLVGIVETCVRKHSELVSASLNASLVSFQRWSSSCRVIQAEILESYTNMSNQKGASSPLEGSSSMTYQVRPLSAFLCLLMGMVPQLELV